MNIKRYLFVILMLFVFLVPSVVFGEEEEKELEVKELSGTYTDFSSPKEWEDYYYLTEKNRIVIINEKLIVSNNSRYYYGGYDNSRDYSAWRIINEDYISFNNKNSVTIYDSNGKIVDNHEINEKGGNVLSYNPEKKKFVFYEYDKEVLSYLYDGYYQDTLNFITSYSTDTKYVLLGGSESAPSYFFDTFTGKRVGEIYSHYVDINPMSQMIYLMKFDESFNWIGNALYNLNGEVIIPFTKNRIGETAYSGGFWAYNITEKYTTIEIDGKYGIFDVKNKTMLIEPMYDHILQMDYRGYFVVKKDDKYGMVDANNTVMFGFDYQRIHISGNYIAIGWDNMVQVLDFNWNERTAVYCQSPNEKMGNCRTQNIFAALDLVEPFLLLQDYEPGCMYPVFLDSGVWNGYPDCGGFIFYDKNGYNTFHNSTDNSYWTEKYNNYYVRNNNIYDVYGTKILSSVEDLYYEVPMVTYHNKNDELVLYNFDTKKDVLKTKGKYIEVTKNYVIVKESEKIKIYNGNGVYYGYVKGDSLNTLGNDIFILTKDGMQQIVKIHLSNENWNKNVHVVEIEGPPFPIEEQPIIEEEPIIVVDSEEEVEIEEVKEQDNTFLFIVVLISICCGGYTLYMTGYYKMILDMIKKKVEKTKDN